MNFGKPHYFAPMANPVKIGILGGGQLGRMLLQSAANYHAETHVLENDENTPAAHLCNVFHKGDIRDFDTVFNFGKQLDVITIEIENVNVEALFALEKEGVKIIPTPAALQTIKDKGLQKQFYIGNDIPTSEFVLTGNQEDLRNYISMLPAAHKMSTGGYDGKGVEILKSETDFAKAFNSPSVLERLVDIEKEIAVMVAINAAGEVAVFPPVEMVFNPVYNLVDYLVSPARITDDERRELQKTAEQVAHGLKSPGVFAVEMFIDKTGKIFVNETAPRAHNSGHQSIEGNFCSQYDMQMRVLLNLPLGNTDNIMPSLMLNLIGEEGYSGRVLYQGLSEILKMERVYVHLYGKTETKPGRKMGHVTILSNHYDDLMEKAAFIKNTLKVVSSK